MATLDNITNNIANSTVTYTAVDSSGLAIVLKISGKTFTNADLPHYFCRVNNGTAFNPTLWQNGASIRWTKSGNFNSNTPILLYDDLTPPARSLTVTKTETHATISGIPQNVDIETVLTLTATAGNGYEFNAAPYIEFNEMVLDENGNPLTIKNFTVSNDKLTATLSVDLSQYDLEYINQCTAINIVAVATEITPTPPPETEITITQNLQNCTVSGMPQNVYTDTVLNLTVTANTDYEFNTAPNINGLDTNGNPIVINSTLSNNNTVATFTNVDLANYNLDENTELELYAVANAVTPYVEKYGTINVYKVTTQNLSDFAALRFIKEKENPSDTSGYFQLIDLGDYVVSVKRFYCPITDVLTAYIKAGNYNTNIQAETPQNDNFLIDCGTVTIPNKNNSIIDYQTEIKIFLPFVGFVGVSSDYVGKTLTLKYKINIITGNSLALLTCNGIEVDFIQCTVSNDIIYKTNKENVFGGNAEFNLQVLKGLQPYAVIKYFTDENKQIYNADCKRVLLSEISGYFVVSELTNFAANITETENQMLLNELSNGVIILGF